MSIKFRKFHDLGKIAKSKNPLKIPKIWEIKYSQSMAQDFSRILILAKLSENKVVSTIVFFDVEK